MMQLFAVSLLLAAAPPPPAEIRPEISDVITQAQKLVDDLDEQKALDSLDATATRKDLTSAEFAALQLWRGVALMSLNKAVEGQMAFSLARGCNGLLEVPSAVSPKIRQSFGKAAPADCPIGAPPPPEEPVAEKPTENVAAKPAEKTPASTGNNGGSNSSPPSQGGIPMLAMVGGGVAVAGGVILLLAVVAAVAAVGLLVGSFPVLANAQAAERAKDARQGAMVALGFRVGAGLVGTVAALGLLAALGAVGAGVATAVAGFVM
jgi:hypothetical protein